MFMFVFFLLLKDSGLVKDKDHIWYLKLFIQWRKLRYHLNQVTNVDMTRNVAYGHHAPHDR